MAAGVVGPALSGTQLVAVIVAAGLAAGLVLLAPRADAARAFLDALALLLGFALAWRRAERRRVRKRERGP